MRLIVAVGCDGKNCLLDMPKDVPDNFDLGQLDFINQPTKSGVYLVEVKGFDHSTPTISERTYQGTFKLLYHPEFLPSAAQSQQQGQTDEHSTI